MTTPLAKATLQKVGPQPADPKPEGDPIPVQFNPTTLRLQLANNVDMKKAFARPATQYEGTSSATLSFDLIFDTADEGTTETPVDVRERTRTVEQFVLPAKGVKSVPPRVKFSYGPAGRSSFELIGVMTGLNQDFDLFAASGVPLRAKLSVTIKEQRPEFDATRTGPGANTAAAAQDPDRRVPGAAGPAAPAPDRSAPALAGESAANLADRVGLDPEAWKALDLGLLDPLRLPAGFDIGFPATVGLDVGVTLGVGVGASADASPLTAGRASDPAAVTGAGGLSRVLDRESAAQTERAAQAARAAVAGPARATAAGPAATADAPRRAEPPPVRPDPRAVSFGFGVPLRERPVPSERIGAGPPPATDDPTVPGWEALRPGPQGRAGGSGRSPCR